MGNNTNSLSRWSLVLLSFVSLIVTGCGGSDEEFVITGNNGSRGVVTVSLNVTPANRTIAVGTTQQFTATATASDGTSADVTELVTWTSSNPAVATINDDGLATAVSNGTTTITASGAGFTATAALTVSNATLTDLQVTPATANVAVGATRQFTATALFSDGTEQNVTNVATWDSNADAVATVNTAGLATGVSAGTATISASFGGDTDTATLTVGGTPPNPPLAVDDNYVTIVDTPLSIAAPGVLENDTVNDATISAFDATSDDGGTVSLAANGSFTYTPAAGFSGEDSFSYTLTNSAGSDTATVTINVATQIWFVDDSADAGGDGSFEDPFQTIEQGTTAASDGEIVYVFSGDYNEDVTLGLGELLVGQGAAFDGSDPPVLGQVIPAGTAPTISGPILCTGDNLVQGVEVDSCTDVDGAVQSAFPSPNVRNNLTLRDLTISSPAGIGINLTLAQPNVSFPEICTQEIRDVAITSAGAQAIYISNRRSQNYINIVDNVLNGSVGTTIDMDNAGSFGFDTVITGNTIVKNGTGVAFDAKVDPVFGFGTFLFTDNSLSGDATDILSINDGGSVTFQIEDNSFASASDITMSDINAGLVFTKIVDLANLAANNTGTLTLNLTNIDNAETLGTGVVANP